MRPRTPGSARRLAAALVAAACLASLAPAGAAPPESHALADGTYRGTLHWSGTYLRQIGDGAVEARFSGAGDIAELVIDGTGMPRGSWNFALASEGDGISMPGSGRDTLDANGVAGFTIDDGTFGGSDADVCLAGTAHATGTATISDPGITVSGNGLVQVEFDVPVTCDPTDENGFALTIAPRSVTCQRVVGDFTVQAAVRLRERGEYDGVGSIVLWRTGPGLSWDDEIAATENLLRRLDDVLFAQRLDVNAMLEVVADAERLEGNLPLNVECGQRSTVYASVLSAAMRAFLVRVIETPDGIDAGTLASVVHVAVRVGAIGSGAFDRAEARQVESDLWDEVARRIDAAAGNTDDAIILSGLAYQMGWPDLEARANEAASS